MPHRNAKNCGDIEDMDHKQAVPTNEDKSNAGKETMNYRQYDICTCRFSMGEEMFKDLLDTKDQLIYYTRSTLI